MGIVEIKLNFRNQNQEMANILHYQFDDNEVRDYQIAADYIRDAWVNGLSNRIAADCFLESITYRELGFQTVETEQPFTLGQAQGASSATSSEVSQVALNINKVGTVPLKPNKGYMYVTGLADDQTQDGLFTQACADACETWAISMKTVPAGGPGGLAMVIYSRTNEASGNGLIVNLVDAFIPRLIAATLRRRKRNVGQ